MSSELHRLPLLVAGYTTVTKQGDPKGSYLCSDCMMYIPDGEEWGGCTAVLPDRGEPDGLHISGKQGGCNLFIAGKPAAETQKNPNRLTKADAGYSQDGPFGCRRCGNYLGLRQSGCVRVVADKKLGVAYIEADACCDGWMPEHEVPVEVRRVFAPSGKDARAAKSPEYCPECATRMSHDDSRGIDFCRDCAFTVRQGREVR